MPVKSVEPPLAPGDRIGDYRIECLLDPGAGAGEGGPWAYSARHLALDRPFAVKVYARDAFAPDEIGWHWRACRSFARIGHPAVVRLYDLGEQGALFYVVLEFVRGKDLAQLVQAAQGPLPWRSAVRLIQMAATGLQAVHHQGLVHQAVRPSNIMLSRDRHVVLMEPRPGGREMALRHAGFCSPEQILGQGLDARSDIFSLGSTLYFLLAGRAPFRGSLEEVRQQLAGGAAARTIRQLNPAVPEGLSTVLARAMARRPEHRYPTPEEMARDVRRQLRANEADGVSLSIDPSQGQPPGKPQPELLPLETRRVSLGEGLKSIGAGMVRGVGKGVHGLAKWMRPRRKATGAKAQDASEDVPPGEPRECAQGTRAPADPADPPTSPAAPAAREDRVPSTGSGSASPGKDVVECSVFAPPAVAQGQTILVQVFAHLPEQAQQAQEQARQVDEEAAWRARRSLEAEIARGQRLMLHLTAGDLAVDDPVQSLVWRGNPESVAFGVTAPADHRTGTVVGTVTVSIDTVPVGHVKFKLTVGRAAEMTSRQEPVALGENARRYKLAFISYASKDRAEVLKRVQMLRTVDIRYFQDVLDLEPGDRWAQQLYERIARCDLFLLFWSSAAKQSPWVMKEIQGALARKGSDERNPPEIVPVIIEGPPCPEPPPELAHLHFNDRLLYFMQSAASAAHGS